MGNLTQSGYKRTIFQAGFNPNAHCECNIHTNDFWILHMVCVKRCSNLRLSMFWLFWLYRREGQTTPLSSHPVAPDVLAYSWVDKNCACPSFRACCWVISLPVMCVVVLGKEVRPCRFSISTTHLLSLLKGCIGCIRFFKGVFRFIWARVTPRYRLVLICEVLDGIRMCVCVGVCGCWFVFVVDQGRSSTFLIE